MHDELNNSCVRKKYTERGGKTYLAQRQRKFPPSPLNLQSNLGGTQLGQTTNGSDRVKIGRDQPDQVYLSHADSVEK
jgi:hypothetical protein